jgi:hypothetical protein
MGYTHYWKIKPQPITDAEVEKIRRRFRSASSTIKRFAKFVKVQDLFEVRGGLGHGKPIINESEVWLNGDANNDLSCETFAIHWDDFIENKSEFCKTRRNPYDLIVCFALLAFKEAFKKEFTFFSDGGLEDWEEAFRIYEQFTGKTPICTLG